MVKDNALIAQIASHKALTTTNQYFHILTYHHKGTRVYLMHPSC